MTEEEKWDSINARKRKDICWVAAWNQAATILTACTTSGEDVEKLAKDIFSRMYAPYVKDLPEEEWLEDGKPVVNEKAATEKPVREFKQTANIDEEIKFPF